MGRTDCSATVSMTTLQFEWACFDEPDGAAALGVVLAFPFGHIEVMYEDSGRQRASSDRGLFDLGPGAFIQIPLGKRSLLRWTYLCSLNCYDSIVEWRYDLGERVALSLGYRDLHLLDTCEQHFPVLESGSQVISISSRGYVAGLVLEF
jgi:hypothetical protein